MSRQKAEDLLSMLGIGDDVDTTADKMHRLCMETLADAMRDEDPLVRLAATSQYVTLMVGPPITNLVVGGGLPGEGGADDYDDDGTLH